MMGWRMKIHVEKERGKTKVVRKRYKINGGKFSYNNREKW
jgi:hypothetical protein